MSKKNNSKTKMINQINDWDFNATPRYINQLKKTATLTIHPVPLVSADIPANKIQEIVEANKGKEFDLLNNGSYPLFDGDSGFILCGNRAVALALVEADLATISEKKVEYPVYFDCTKN